ncbi:MAG: hypothetical protein ACO34J_05125 [Prochlorothrix sp.]
MVTNDCISRLCCTSRFWAPLYQDTDPEVEGSYAFFPADNVSARALLEPDDRLIWTVEANSWEEASQAQYRYLGWGHYHPMPNPVWQSLTRLPKALLLSSLRLNRPQFQFDLIYNPLP